MKTKLRYLIISLVVVIIILLAGGYQLPKYASRVSAIALLAIVDMLYWLSIRKSLSARHSKSLKIIYWLPLAWLLVFFITGLLAPYSEWPPFLRIYVPGFLMILMIGKGIFLSLLVAGDILVLPFNFYRKLKQGNNSLRVRWYRPRVVLVFASVVSGLVMMIFISGMFFWVNNFKLTTVEILVKDLPREFEGYKILQLSDMHLGSFATTRPVNKILDIIKAQNPDLILFTGDLVNFTTQEALRFEEELKRFRAKDGVYSILGNHDYGEYSQWNSDLEKEQNNKAFAAFYKRIGWHLLRNQNAIIKRDSASIAIIGVENWSMNKRFGKRGDLKKALSGAGQRQFKILMSHDPSHWDGEVNWMYPQIGLTLSGHTHAFQIAIEQGNIKWSPASLLYKEWGGLYEKIHPYGNKQYLYVNRGAGTLGYPGRIGVRPEITLIILRRSG